MQELEFLGNRVAVEKADKLSSQSQKSKENLFVVEPMVSDNLGVVRYVGEGVKDAKFEVGSKVYFGNKREQLRIAGKDIMVMDAENVLAVVTETQTEISQVVTETVVS